MQRIHFRFLVVAAAVALTGHAPAAEDFENCKTGHPLHGQAGWIVNKPPAVMVVKPGHGNDSKAAVELKPVGDNDDAKGPIVAERPDKSAKAALRKGVQYVAWLRPAAGDAFMVAPRTSRAKGQPMLAGGQAAKAGLGPRFGFVARPKPTFALLGAEQPVAKAVQAKTHVEPGQWYELRLVVPATDDPSKATGTLCWRQLGKEQWRMPEALVNVPLHFGDAASPDQFAGWVVIGRGGQADNLSAGPAEPALLELIRGGPQLAKLRIETREQADQLAATRKELAAVRKEAAAAKKEAAGLEDQVKSLKQQAQKLKASAGEMGKQFHEQKKLANELTAKVKSLETRLDEMQKARTALTKHVATWKKRAEEAEARLAAIEGARNEIPAWKKQENWRKLEVGQSPDKVRTILGEPGKVYTGSVEGKPRTVWYYPSPHGGHVEFAERKVRAWKEP